MKAATHIFSLETPRRRKQRGRKSPSVISFFRSVLSRTLNWFRTRQLARDPRKLKLLESVSLGDKRFAAVLEYEGHRFLIGGAPQSVQLLTPLPSSSFSATLATKQAAAPEAN